MIMGQAQGQGSGQKRWVERALLNEARGSVRGVEFGPNAFGLKLVSVFSLSQQVVAFARVS